MLAVNLYNAAGAEIFMGHLFHILRDKKVSGHLKYAVFKISLNDM